MKSENKIYKLVLIITLFCILAISGCNQSNGIDTPPNVDNTKPDKPNNNNNNVNLDGDASDIVNANNKFCFDIYSEYKDTGMNVFFSPYSITSAFAMAYEGSVGETRDELSKVLYFPKNKEKMHSSSSAMINMINKDDKDYTLRTANALWIQEDFPLLEEYLDNVENIYQGKTTNLDFVQETEKSRVTINEWVEDQTNDKIKDLIPAGLLSSSTKLVITNAIYFLGDWVKAFNKENTFETNFYLRNGETIKVDMMERADDEARFNYFEDESLQALEMDYKGEEISMIVFLPEDGQMEEFENSLNLNRLKEIKSNLEMQRVEVYFPKFKIETKYLMGDTLRDLGMQQSFSSNADFSGITGNRDIFISEVVHQAYVEVDEEGTEAAAATAIVLKATAAVPEPVIPIFKADRPFIFLIQHKETGEILFMGKINNPKG